jgi:hypothetical protein
MKKEMIYSLRMSKTVRNALKKAAQKESRTVASLLDKIIKDYLDKEGLLAYSDSIMERRWFTRKEIYKPANIYFEKESGKKEFAIVVLNVSLGGVLIGYPKSSEIQFSVNDLPEFELCLDLKSVDKPLCFNCESKRLIDKGYGIQIGANFLNPNEKDLQMLRAYLN